MIEDAHEQGIVACGCVRQAVCFATCLTSLLSASGLHAGARASEKGSSGRLVDPEAGTGPRAVWTGLAPVDRAPHEKDELLDELARWRSSLDVREYAARLDRMGDEAAISLLRAALCEGIDAGHPMFNALDIGLMDADVTIPLLVESFWAQKEPRFRQRAARVLAAACGGVGAPDPALLRGSPVFTDEIRSWLRSVLQDLDSVVRFYAVRCHGRLGLRVGPELFSALIWDSDDRVRELAIKYAPRLADAGAVREVLGGLEPDDAERAWLVRALRWLSPEEYARLAGEADRGVDAWLASCAEALPSTDLLEQSGAFLALVDLVVTHPEEVIGHYLDEEDGNTRRWMRWALIQAPDLPAALDTVVSAQGLDTPEVARLLSMHRIIRSRLGCLDCAYRFGGKGLDARDVLDAELAADVLRRDDFLGHEPRESDKEPLALLVSRRLMGIGWNSAGIPLPDEVKTEFFLREACNAPWVLLPLHRQKDQFVLRADEALYRIALENLRRAWQRRYLYKNWKELRPLGAEPEHAQTGTIPEPGLWYRACARSLGSPELAVSGAAVRALLDGGRRGAAAVVERLAEVGSEEGDGPLLYRLAVAQARVPEILRAPTGGLLSADLRRRLADDLEKRERLVELTANLGKLHASADVHERPGLVARDLNEYGPEFLAVLLDQYARINDAPVLRPLEKVIKARLVVADAPLVAAAFRRSSRMPTFIVGLADRRFVPFTLRDLDGERVYRYCYDHDLFPAVPVFGLYDAQPILAHYARHNTSWPYLGPRWLGRLGVAEALCDLEAIWRWKLAPPPRETDFKRRRRLDFLGHVIGAQLRLGDVRALARARAYFGLGDLFDSSTEAVVDALRDVSEVVDERLNVAAPADEWRFRRLNLERAWLRWFERAEGNLEWDPGSQKFVLKPGAELRPLRERKLPVKLLWQMFGGEGDTGARPSREFWWGPVGSTALPGRRGDALVTFMPLEGRRFGERLRFYDWKAEREVGSIEIPGGTYRASVHPRLAAVGYPGKVPEKKTSRKPRFALKDTLAAPSSGLTRGVTVLEPTVKCWGTPVFVGDGRRWVVTFAGRLILYSFPDMKELWSTKFADGLAGLRPVPSPSGRYVAVVGMRATVFDLADRKMLPQVRIKDRASQHATFGPGESSLIVCGFSEGMQFRRYSLPDMDLVEEWDGPHGRVSCVDVSPDGRLLAFGHYGDPAHRRSAGLVALWDLKEKRELVSWIAVDTWVDTVRFHPRRNLLMVCGRSFGTNGPLQIWEYDLDTFRVGE